MTIARLLKWPQESTLTETSRLTKERILVSVEVATRVTLTETWLSLRSQERKMVEVATRVTLTETASAE